ncbi:MAG: hypothetical protein KC431_20215, partial [Myxococcales bacterium]|nr:hypothetical protein [Myxococcales bacterium]
MSRSPILDVLGVGAVTPVGLDATQSCAAIRAGLKRFTAIETPMLPGQDPRVGARISAAPGLRRGEDEWLLNLGARALRECCDRPKFEAESTELFLLIPEAHRGHLLTAYEDAAILDALSRRLELRFAEESRVVRDGAGALFLAIAEAHALIASRRIKRCIVGGADSLLRLFDLERLARSGRLIGPLQSQGVMPGEGAAWVRVRLGEPLPLPDEDDEDDDDVDDDDHH